MTSIANILDDVIEAVDGEGRMYRLDRFYRTVEHLADQPIRNLVEGLVEDRRLFGEGVEQRDDSTILRVEAL